MHLFLLAQVDLGFLIDGSENINKYGAGNFQKCLEFVKLITKPFVISTTDTRVGAIVFSHQTELQFNFNQYKTKPEVEAAIDRIQYPSSLTYDGKGLTMVAEKLFNDIRVGVPRVLVIVTGGWSGDDVTKPSEELRNTGVIILSVGLGTHFNKAQLYVMASDPKEDNVFTVAFPQIQNIVMAIQYRISNGKLIRILIFSPTIYLNVLKNYVYLVVIHVSYLKFW